MREKHLVDLSRRKEEKLFEFPGMRATMTGTKMATIVAKDSGLTVMVRKENGNDSMFLRISLIYLPSQAYRKVSKINYLI